MGPEHFWWGGMWIFPMTFFIIMLFVCLVVVYLIFGRGGYRPPWQDRGSETALEILKKRYAKGEINKEEFEQIKKNLE
jgi:putative membrane protein